MHFPFTLHRSALSGPVRRAFVASALLVVSLVAASAEPVVDPLALGIDAPASDERLGLKLEAWAQGMDLRREDSGADALARAVLDFRHEWSLGASVDGPVEGPGGAGWRLNVSNRLEAVEFSGEAEGVRRNALRELFVGGPVGSSWFFDAGRINLRQGVAQGYNPTDYLRENAVVMRSSQNPAALRENRLGAAMLRAQWLDAAGSAQLAVLPQLSDEDEFDDDTWALGLERTNRHGAALLRLSPYTGERLAIDFTTFAREGDALQSGVNVSWTANDALVLQLEWSGGRRAAVPTVDHAAGRERWFNRLAAGGSWTTPVGVVLSVEHHYAGDALAEADWNDWRAAQGPAAGRLGALRQDLLERQDLLARRYWFGRLAWDRAFGLERLDLSGFARRNAYDRSTLWQGEAAWHADARWDLGLQFTRSTGVADSEFGAAPVRASLALYLRCFL